jgi:TolA-binding protein
VPPVFSLLRGGTPLAAIVGPGRGPSGSTLAADAVGTATAVARWTHASCTNRHGAGEETICMKALSAACLALTCVLVAPRVPALAQADSQLESKEAIRLENQILELRQEIQALRDQLASAASGGGSALGGYQAPPAGAPPADITAQLLSRVQRLEDDVRTLRGRVDEVDNAQQRLSEDVNKQLGDLNFKIDNGAAGGAPQPGGATPAPAPRPSTMSPPPGNLALVAPGAPDVAPPPPPPPVKRTPEMILQEGNNAYTRRDYAAAEAAAKTVLAVGGPRATDAQFLLARALYGKRDFSNAAVAFDDTYNRSRTGVHAPDALLGLAVSLNGIQEKKAACQTLDKLAVEFPSPRPDLRASVAAARRDAGCH